MIKTHNRYKICKIKYKITKLSHYNKKTIKFKNKIQNMNMMIKYYNKIKIYKMIYKKVKLMNKSVLFTFKIK